VVVCLRVGGSGESGEHEHGVETAMAMMGEMGLGPGD
jgi:hypothetical protein